MSAAQLPLFGESTPKADMAGLNSQQLEAVRHPHGPLMIIAGPGTGKTRTLTHRIAHLITTCEVPSTSILAVTFTNKAAQEMAARLADLLGPEIELPLAATFHGFCLGILKKALDTDIQIVDEDQRQALLADAIDRVAADRPPSPQLPSRELLLKWIVGAKQRVLGPEDPLDSVCPPVEQARFRAVYWQYQRLMEIEKRCDYEELIFRTVRFLETDENFAKRCQERYTHVLVDEYQDINPGQYRVIRALVGAKAANLFVIGDPNQSIYGFRGSDTAYFHRFVENFPNARTVRLTRNYRSSAAILTASTQVMRQAHGDLSQKRLYSDTPGERTVGFMELASEQAEAVAIGKIIEKMVGGLDFHVLDSGRLEGNAVVREKSFADFAVLYRTHGQGHAFAEAFRNAGIPYQIARPVRRCGERGITGLLSFVRVLSGLGTYSDFNAIRDLTVPGIGPGTFKAFKAWGYRCGFPLKKALYQASRLPIADMTTRRQKRLFEVITYLSVLVRETELLSLQETMKFIVDNTKLSRFFEKAGDGSVKEHLETLLNLAGESDADMARLSLAVALQSDTDVYETRAERVALMTMHAAKGLEFPVVFIAGCENELIPYTRGSQIVDLEEERRLFYVAMTRAEEHLYFSCARKRTVFGRQLDREVSPFVADIEKGLIRREAAAYSKKHPRPQMQMTLF